MKAILYVAHGSRLKEGTIEVKRMLETIMQEVPNKIQEGAFLELARPNIEEGIDKCVARGATSIVMIPLFLFSTGHVKEDIPVILQSCQSKHPNVSMKLVEAIGVREEINKELIREIRRKSNGVTDKDSILIIGRGSRDRKIHSWFDSIQFTIQTETGIKQIETCYLAATKPLFKDSLRRKIELTEGRVIIVPYLLFPGLLWNEIKNKCKEFDEKIFLLQPLHKLQCIKAIMVETALKEV